MVIDLKISERLELWKLLPAQGNIVTIKAIRCFREAISMGADIEDGGVVQEGEQLTWKDDYTKPFDVSPTINKIVTKALEDLDSQEKITDDLIGLWDKFVEMGEPAVSG